MNWFQRFEKGVPGRLQPYLTLYVIAGLAICIISLLVFGQIVDGVADNAGLVRFDTALANALHSVATAGSTATFVQISLLGSEILFGWCAVVALILALQKRWLALIMWLIAIVGGELLNALLKLAFARPRPTFATPLVIERYYSFPSGHAMMSFIAYGMLAYVLCLMVTNSISRFIIVLCASTIILLIGVSRIALGVHYFSDVVAGYSVAAMWLITCIGTWRFIQQRRVTPLPTA